LSKISIKISSSKEIPKFHPQKAFFSLFVCERERERAAVVVVGLTFIVANSISTEHLSSSSKKLLLHLIHRHAEEAASIFDPPGSSSDEIAKACPQNYHKIP